MAQFIGLVTLNAANFDSGAAGDGEVLTADGAGGAAWEAAGGGGGASFAFDGATFTPSEFVADSGYREILVALTSGGDLVGDGDYVVEVYCISADGTATVPMDVYGNLPYINVLNASGNTSIAFHKETGLVESIPVFPTNWESTDPIDAKICVCLPSGGVYKSISISVPGYVAP